MPPQVNGDRTSVNGDGKLKSDSSDLGESNGVGGDLPRAAMATDRAPKTMSFSAVVHGQNRGFGWRSWSKMKVGDVRSRTQPVVQPNSGEIDGDKNGLSRSLSSFDCRRSGCFLMTMTTEYDRRRSSFRLVPSLTGTVAGNRRWSRVGLVGRVGLNGSTSLSLLLSRVPLSLSSFGNQFPPFHL